MIEYKFYNRETAFISALKIECDAQPREFSIYGSHQNNPTDWIEVPFELLREAESVLLTFKKQVNYACFLIQITGTAVAFHKIQSGSLIPKNEAQIKEILSQASVAILGCARDCENNLSNSLDQLQRIGELFSSYKMYVFENDSKDQTLSLLNKATTKYPLKIQTERDLDKVFTSRTERLSYCRNHLLDLSKESNYDYYIVADLDGVFNEINTERFKSCFKYDCWEGCFPVSSDKYYDLWALRHPYLMPGDYNVKMNQLPYMLAQENAQRLVAVPLRGLEFSKSKGWLEVESAFGGLGVYKGYAYKASRYAGHKNGIEICEHVALHKNMASEQARLYINPEFVVS